VNSPIEPSAAFVVLAQQHAQLWEAYRRAGFTPDQSLAILCTLIAAWAAPRNP
jgi:transposase